MSNAAESLRMFSAGREAVAAGPPPSIDAAAYQAGFDAGVRAANAVHQAARHKPPPLLLDATELGELLGASAKTILRWRDAGKLPPALPLFTKKNSPVWKLETILAWLELECVDQQQFTEHVELQGQPKGKGKSRRRPRRAK